MKATFCVLAKIVLLSSILISLRSAGRGEGSLDLQHYAFSHYGSYMSVIYKTDQPGHPAGYYIQDISGRRMWHWKGIFKVDFIENGDSVSVTAHATPSRIVFTSSSGQVEACFDGPNILRFRGTGLGIRLTQHVQDGSSQSFPITKDGNQWRVQMGGYDNYVLTGLAGQILGDAAKTVTLQPIPERPQLIISALPDGSGKFEIAFEQYQDAWSRKAYESSFDDCIKQSQESHEQFSSKLLPVPARFSELFKLAHYVKWSSVVGKKDLIKRDAYYCSKNWMTGVWPWDNCFSAMSSANSDMRWAIDQVLVSFDHQTAKGAIPGLITDNSMMWGSYKPPIQGYAFSKIMKFCKERITDEQLAEIYVPIALYTNFWFNHLDDDQNGIPQYNHANDSGEDNGAVFEAGYPIESPDLCAFLILQCDFLKEVAIRLGKRDEARNWAEHSDRLLHFLTTSLWTGEIFVAKNTITGLYSKDAHSFLQYTPLILGDRLPEAIRKKLIARLKVRTASSLRTAPRVNILTAHFSTRTATGAVRFGLPNTIFSSTDWRSAGKWKWRKNSH
jgi:putative isomerase